MLHHLQGQMVTAEIAWGREYQTGSSTNRGCRPAVCDQPELAAPGVAHAKRQVQADTKA